MRTYFDVTNRYYVNVNNILAYLLYIAMETLLDRDLYEYFSCRFPLVHARCTADLRRQIIDFLIKCACQTFAALQMWTLSFFFSL